MCVLGNLCIMVGSGAGFKDQSTRQDLYLDKKKPLLEGRGGNNKRPLVAIVVGVGTAIIAD